MQDQNSTLESKVEKKEQSRWSKFRSQASSIYFTIMLVTSGQELLYLNVDTSENGKMSVTAKEHFRMYEQFPKVLYPFMLGVFTTDMIVGDVGGLFKDKEYHYKRKPAPTPREPLRPEMYWY